MYLVSRAFFCHLALIAMAAILVGCVAPGRPVVAERSPPSEISSGSPPAAKPLSGQRAWRLPQTGVAPVYTVRTGDTLYSIAWRFGLEYQRFARANAVPAPYTIYPGQRLRLTDRTSSTVSKTAATTTKPQQRVVKTAPARSTPKTPATKAKPPPSVDIRPPSAGDWTWPVATKPWREFKQNGKGIDFRLPAGRGVTPLRSVAPGRVVYAGNGIGEFERLVIVKHGNALLSAYSFNGRLIVAEEQEIKAGAEIADIKSDTRGTQLLHFELRKDGQPINPRRYLP